MAIIINNYNSQMGITLDAAYMVINQIDYKPISGLFNFSASIFANKQAFLNNSRPLEDNVIYGTLYNVDYNGENLISIAENAILDKINIVKDKTLEECEIHNNEVYAEVKPYVEWIDLWEYQYNRFNGAYIDGE